MYVRNLLLATAMILGLSVVATGTVRLGIVGTHAHVAPVAQAEAISSPATDAVAAAGVLPGAAATCKGEKDARRGSAKAAPFAVCGIAVISKRHRVSAGYHPALVTVPVRSNGIGTVRLQRVAGSALVTLFSAAHRAGYTLTVRSAYRSYASQKSWYGSGSDPLVAPPGASEHQSGLAVDLAWLRKGTLVRGTAFGASKAAAWLRKHSTEYGFILRYPTGKQKITGISYEPWHYRYVGVEAARGVERTASRTLERYLRVS